MTEFQDAVDFFVKLCYNIYSKINGGVFMPIIKPVSDLRNYNEVLRTIQADNPVFLTKNGRGKYVIVDYEDYEKKSCKCSSYLPNMIAI